MTAGFVIREGFRAWRRSGLAGGLATISLAVLAAFVMLIFGARQSISLMRSNLLAGFEIEAFVVPGRDTELENVAARIREQTGVVGVETIDREQAAERFAERHGEDLLGLLEENPLPASVIVHFSPDTITVNQMMAAADLIEADPDIDEVVFEGDLLRRFEEVSSRVGWWTAAVGFIFLFIAITLTLQAVKVAARTGRYWARAVRLIGGSSAQIRWPLAVSGMITGLTGGIIGAGAIGFLQWWFSGSPWIESPGGLAVALSVLLPVVIGLFGSVHAWHREF